MPNLSICFLLLSSSLPILLFSQIRINQEYLPLSAQKSPIDFFETVDEKSYYQRQRIQGMKRDINDYSERLHTLQRRFDEIFYGLSGKGSFNTPFDLTETPDRPTRRQLIEEDSFSPEPASPSTKQLDYQSDLIEPSKIVPPQDQLAFQVDGPGSFVQNDENKILFNTGQTSSDKFGKYVILTPGLAIPYKIHRPNPGAFKSTYRRYDPGVSLTITGGLEKNGFRFGLGSFFKSNSHHDSSYERVGLTKTYFDKQSRTFAGFLDLGYRMPLFGSIDGFARLGLGYYLSMIEAPRSRKEHGFFATGNLAIAYNFSEMIAMSLGYRFVLEEEVPAHLIELGLGFDF